MVTSGQRGGIGRRTLGVSAAMGFTLAALVAALASVGDAGSPVASAATAFYLIVAAGLPAGFYIFGAVGLGRLFRPWTAGARDPVALQVGLGLALMLSLSHGLGCLGLLAGASGRIMAVGVCLAGIVLLASGPRPARWAPPAPLVLALPGLAIMLVAAVQPPGWLWRSEFGGFDALSYHLQLPQEWLLRGRLEPLPHNVYSYLPGYVEAAFLHIAAIIGAPLPRPGEAAYGLVAGDGAGAIACQLLHAGLGVVAAWLLARCVRMVTAPPGDSLARSTPGSIAGWTAAAFLLATPWVVVVGSLAYNDLGVVALGAAAATAALDPALSPARRGAIAGLLVGVACGCKPTALPFLAPPLAVLLLGLTSPRNWAPLIAAGCAAGLTALAPWLIRNTLSGGNPVFPYLTSVFGTAHWSPEQAGRFGRATFVHASLAERLALLVAADPLDPAGARHRGLMHPQWFAFFPLVGAAAIAVLARPPTRRVGVLLVLGLLAQTTAWLYASHLQSRFLLPLAIPATLLIGLATTQLLASARARGPWFARGATAILVAVVLLQTVASAWNFAWQQRARPNALLVAGAGYLSGALFRTWPQAEAMGGAAASPEAFLNLALPPGRVVYLLGDATPLYVGPPVRYHTVWDASPLADAVRAHPDDPARWGESLRRADVRFVLVNAAELDRYRRSGYIDPALTPEVIARFLDACGRLIREWPGGRALFELVPPEGGAVGEEGTP